MLSRAYHNIKGMGKYERTYECTSIGGHVQTRLRSPYTLSIRPTVGQNFVEELTQGAGNAVEGRKTVK